MRKISKYVSDDGREFCNEEECKKWEELNSKYQKIMSKLPQRTEDSCFLNGKGFIQHSQEVLFPIIEEFEKLAIQELKLRGYKDIIGNERYDSYLFGRVMSDFNCASCKYLWRLICINKASLREYGQPYYANHESEVGV